MKECVSGACAKRFLILFIRHSRPLVLAEAHGVQSAPAIAPRAGLHDYSPPLRASSSRYERPICWTPCTVSVTPSSSVKVSPAAQGPDSARTIYLVSRIEISAPCTTWEKSFSAEVPSCGPYLDFRRTRGR